MKYVIDDEEREVTIITMGKNDTVDDLIAAFEGREEYKVIVMDNPYLEGEYDDIPDEYSNDDDEHSRIKEIADSDVEEHTEILDHDDESENPDHTVWTVEVEAIRKVFATKEDAQKYIDNLISMMNKERMFKVKKLDVNPNKMWEDEMDDRTDDPIGLFEEEAGITRLRRSIAHRWDMSDWKSKEGEKGNVDTRGCA
jgi:hypothetical protein